MWHLDIPSESELRLLAAINASAVVTIYMPTTPISQDAASEAMVLHNLVKEAMIDVRQRPELPRGDDDYIEVQLLDLIDDDDFWAHQSHGLGVITTPDGQWTFRLPHRPNPQVYVDNKASLIQLISRPRRSRWRICPPMPPAPPANPRSRIGPRPDDWLVRRASGYGSVSSRDWSTTR
jgi:hypothetical protein